MLACRFFLLLTKMTASFRIFKILFLNKTWIIVTRHRQSREETIKVWAVRPDRVRYLLLNRQLGTGPTWELRTQSSFPTQKSPFKEQYGSGGRYARN